MMSFFVVERDPADGSVRVLVHDPVADRSAALEALSARIASGEVTIAGEVFVVDLSTAVPVLLMPVAAPPHAADAWGAAASTDTVLGDLAEALKRATTSLESEGIVAPDSIDAGKEDASAPPDDELVQDEPVEGVVSRAPVDVRTEHSAEPVEIDTPPVVDGAAAEVAEPVGEAAWPWTNVDALPVGEEPELSAPPAGEQATPMVALEEVAPEPVDAPDTEELTVPGGHVIATPDDGLDEVQAAIASLGGPDVTEPVSYIAEPAGVADSREPLDLPGEPAVSESPLIVPSVIEGDDAYLPKPVILGDYDDTSTSEVFEPASVAQEPAPEDDASLVVDGLSAGTWTPAPRIDDPRTAAYEPVAGLDLGEYTCDDCVYVNTCPKVGQSTPAECGSFQWKSD